MRGDVLVGRGIPLVHVDPVDDAGEAVSQREKHVVETEPADRGAQLVRVRRAHRGHGIGEGEPALEQIHLVMPLHDLVVEQLPGQP